MTDRCMAGAPDDPKVNYDGVALGTFEPKLLGAMLRYLHRHGLTEAVVVPAYRERSYNIGYCGTCSDMVTEVHIYYLRRDGSQGRYEYLGDLGELIRDLTDDQPEERDG